MKKPAFMRWNGFGKFEILGRMKTPFARRIGMNIVKLRGGLGWKQEELAERADVSPTTVQRWESGCVVPCGYDVFKLAVALGVSTDAIYEGLPRSIAAVQAMHSRRCAEPSTVS